MGKICFCSGPEKCRDTSCYIVRDYMRQHGIKDFTAVENFDITPVYERRDYDKDK